MSTKLRTYVDTLFEEAPTAPHVYDLKEELLANLEEKFEDLLAAGYSEEDAYASVISGLGDAESLIASMSVEPEPRDIPYEEARRHTAQTVASSAFCTASRWRRSCWCGWYLAARWAGWPSG